METVECSNSREYSIGGPRFHTHLPRADVSFASIHPLSFLFHEWGLLAAHDSYIPTHQKEGLLALHLRPKKPSLLSLQLVDCVSFHWPIRTLPSNFYSHLSPLFSSPFSHHFSLFFFFNLLFLLYSPTQSKTIDLKIRVPNFSQDYFYLFVVFFSCHPFASF